MRKKKILLVDDELFIRELLRDCLREIELELMEAGDSGGAIQLLRKEKYDLVILDWNLGRSNSREVIDHIRSVPARIPVILMTGDHRLKVEKNDQPVVVDVIYKPFQVDEFISKIDKVLTHHEE